MTNRISVRLPDELAQELEQFCAESGMTKTSVLIQALRESSDFGYAFRPSGKVVRVPQRAIAANAAPVTKLQVSQR